MVKKIRPIVIWSNRSSAAFRTLMDRIRQSSINNAEKIQASIVKLTRDLVFNPEKYPLDKYKMNNPGNYRAFENHSFRIAYKHTPEEIRIIRMRHVKQEPKQYR